MVIKQRLPKGVWYRKEDTIAEAAYRSAWGQWLMTREENRRHYLEDLMDTMKIFIGRGPRDPKWEDFIASLPGYEQYCNRVWWEHSPLPSTILNN